MECSCGTKNLICFLQMLCSKLIHSLCPGLSIPNVEHTHILPNPQIQSLTHTHTDLDIYVPCTHLFILTDLCPTVALSTITASTLYAYLVPWSSELQYL